MALGAAPASVIALVIGQALRLTGIGVALGLVFAVGAATATRSVLVGVTAYDPLTYVAVPLLIVLGATIAAVAPARRALGVDPATVLQA